MMKQFGLAFALICGLGTPSMADDAALLLGTGRYENMEWLQGGSLPDDLKPALEAVGFGVSQGNNVDALDARRLARAFKDDAADAKRLVVVLNGRFATDGTRTWYLAADTEAPNFLNVGQRAISVETIMRLLARAPGQAVLFLGAEDGAISVYDSPLRSGIGRLEVPQGVTIVRGHPRAVEPMVIRSVATPGADLMAEVRRDRQLRVLGYRPGSLVLTAGETANTAAYQDSFGADQEAWEQAQAADSAQGYSRYIDRFPNGVYVEEARKRLDRIRAEPNRAARLAEEALNLSRAARRAIQRDLNVLDYDTRGIDGIFGRGTRQAIRNWQQQNGLQQTTYLTSRQIDRLDAQAARRAAELEAEAERQRQAEERRDRAYWEETGADGRPASLRSYLRRYPDGLFSQEARNALEQIEAAARREARAEERATWDRARERNSVNAYNSYLRKYPEGRFKDNAEAAIAELEQATAGQAARDEARATEQALQLDPITLRLIEGKLEALGLNPGTVDGQLDRDSRRALRNYQRDRGLTRTGYLDQATVSRLLRDVFQ